MQELTWDVVGELAGVSDSSTGDTGFRESLRRMTDGLPADTAAVGGFWTRTNDVEVDLVGADREPIARRVTFVGSVKWKEKKAFDAKDLAELAAHRLRVPGAGEETPMVARTNGGFGLDGWAICGVPSSGGAGCRAVDPESDP